MKHTNPLLLTCVATLLPLAALASPAGQLDTPAGGALANACAGRDGQMGGAGNAGQAYVPGADFACHAVVMPAGSLAAAPQSASGGGSVNGLNYSNHASAAALPAAMHLAVDNDGNNGIPFPGAGADAGYNDHVSVTSLNGNSGSALWVLPFELKADMHSTPQGRAVLTTAAYKDFQTISGGPALTAWLTNNVVNYGDLSGFAQLEQVSVIADGAVPAVQVDATVRFVIPITLGSAFEYGIWTKLFASEQANGPAGPQTQSDADFTLTYLGGSFLILPNNSIDNHLSVDSAAGIDYAHAVAPVPLPASLGLALCGVVTLAARGRRRGLN